MFLHVHRFGEKQKWSFPRCLYLKETYEIIENLKNIYTAHIFIEYNKPNNELISFLKQTL